jgi:division protein CdvB (Snf7/Vps24/ESCRT-III family)
VANEEALKILEEAEVAAESKLKDRLPEIMPGYSINKRESLST